MKTSKFISFLILASVVCACQNEKEPQPDWASGFVGTYLSGYDPTSNGDYFLSALNYYSDSPANIAYLTSLVAVLERVDNTHLNMSLILKPFSFTFTGQHRTILPSIKYSFKNISVVSKGTLVIDETVLNNNGGTILKLDTIVVEPYYRDSTEYKLVSFKVKQIDKLKGDFLIGVKKYFTDTKPRLFYSMTTQNKFELNKRYFFALTDGVKYEWDFGDGSTSTEEDPYHEYKKNGLYKLIFSVTDKSGKKYTAEDMHNVSNLPL